MEKTVMITGASRGIGLATVRLFQSRNWRVAACVRNRAGNEWLGKIADLEVFELDVTKKSSIEKAVDEIKSKMGPIDVLVNNAGYGLIGAFEETPEEEIRSCFETNFFGALNVIKAVLPAMRDARKGCIIQIASVGGRLSFPLYSTYCATKWALEGFSESLAYELKEFGIKVKIVEPGPINTDFHKESMHL
ncbi:MAG TPA: SDR family oxidoreductase, partial [Pyrinomonadaceae bacterium]|nr:SDR family oxidoreductase [Pyrinomonadaceae bacterium]